MILVRPARLSGAGFSLLEVMISMAILALTLVVLIGITTNNVRNTNHAKLMTAATFLARTRIADMEDEVLQIGFGDNDQDEDGNFNDQGYPAFRWHSLVERVELPTDIANKTQNQTSGMSQSNNPMMQMAGLMGGFMTTLIEPIRVGLQESVRRVSVVVSWDEIGRPEQRLEVVLFMTDPAKLDLALQAGAAAASSQNQNQGAGGSSGGAGTGQGAGQGAAAGGRPAGAQTGGPGAGFGAGTTGGSRGVGGPQ